MAYATRTELAEYTGIDESQLPDDSERLLERASDLLDTVTLGRIDTDESEHVTAAQKAACAQVEYWIEGGEHVDIGGAVQSYSIGSLSINYGSGAQRVSANVLAPRAKNALFMAGLLYRGVKVTY